MDHKAALPVCPLSISTAGPDLLLYCVPPRDRGIRSISVSYSLSWRDVFVASSDSDLLSHGPPEVSKELAYHGKNKKKSPSPVN